jgi:hypothetical protein
MVVDGAAGEATHGEERAGVLFHAERTRSRAAPRLLGLGLPLPPSLSLSLSPPPRLSAAIRAGTHGWLGRREAAALQSWRALDPTGGSITRAVPTTRRAAPRRAAPLVLAGSFGWQLGASSLAWLPMVARIIAVALRRPSLGFQPGPV